MSKQLALSAAFSIFTMAAFALFATAPGGGGSASGITGAETLVSTPVISVEAFSPAH